MISGECQDATISGGPWQEAACSSSSSEGKERAHRGQELDEVAVGMLVSFLIGACSLIGDSSLIRDSSLIEASFLTCASS